MALVRDLFIWLLISFHIVGGAILFRRYFPRESPWFGFFLPALALPMILNFIEHFYALPSLLWLAPLTTGGLIYFIFRNDYSWEGLRVPIAVFLVAFAFTFGVRCLNPNITPGSDGLTDLSMTLNYCHGEKVPPTDNWLPTMDYKWYYGFQDYAASVVKRMFNLDGGSAVNVSNALLSALTALAGAAVAYRLSGERAWVAFVMVAMIEAAFTGSSAYIYLTMNEPGEWLADNLGGGFNRLQPPQSDHNPLWHLLGYDTGNFYKVDDGVPMRRELQTSGFWTWRDEYRPNSAGHLFTLFSAFTVVELLRREKTNIPWICAVLIPPLVVITTMWLIFFDGILCLGALALALIYGIRPANWKWVAYGVGIGLISLWPTVSDITTAQQTGGITWNPPEYRTPFWEYTVQFWPVILLWLLLCFSWTKLPLGVRLIHAVIPPFLVAMELFNIDNDRYNTYEKMWGPVFSTAIVCFFPLVVANKNILGRLLAFIIFCCAMVSLTFHLYAHIHWMPDAGAFNLQGDGYLKADPQKKRLLQVMSQLRDATVLAGHCEFNYYESPAIEVFTGNRCYIAWFFAEERFGHGGESGVRTQLNNDFYAGKIKDPLAFLKANDIAAVVVWPGDKIPDELLAQWKVQLAPTYQYEDCRQTGEQNAGVFLRRPLPPIKR